MKQAANLFLNSAVNRDKDESKAIQNEINLEIFNDISIQEHIIA
jgi:hypothetical protein